MVIAMRASAIAAALVLAAAGAAHADDGANRPAMGGPAEAPLVPEDAEVAALIDRAYAERDTLRYREALAAIEEALAVGRASPAQMRALYRLAGELHAGLDEPDEAERWFARWLALVPDGHLRADASPKLTAPLEAARARLRGQAIALVPRRGGDGLAIDVTGDALGAIARLRVLGRGAPIDAVPGARVVEPGATAALGLDIHGNALVAIALAAPPPRPAARRPLLLRWQPYAIGAAAFAAAGGFFAWRTAVAQDDFDALRADSAGHTFAELEAVRTRGERHALLANVGFGLAAASAAVAIVLAVRGDREPAVAPLAASGGGGLAISGRF